MVIDAVTIARAVKADFADAIESSLYFVVGRKAYCVHDDRSEAGFVVISP
jgi:hypothetical protein